MVSISSGRANNALVVIALSLPRRFREPVALNVMFSSKTWFLPDPHLLVDLFQHKRYARMTSRAEQGLGRQWFLLYGQASKEWLLNPQPAMLRKLLPPDDRSWA